MQLDSTGTGWEYIPNPSADPTVKGTGNAIVVAPGTGNWLDGASVSMNNPNIDFNVVKIPLVNKSEVAVKYKAEIDTSSKIAPQLFGWRDTKTLWNRFVMGPGSPSNQIPLQGSDIDYRAGDPTYILGPGEDDVLLLGFMWPFDHNEPGLVAWLNLFGDMSLTAAPDRDYEDSLLGMRAAQYLRGEGGWGPDDVTMKIVVKLTVEQVD